MAADQTTVADPDTGEIGDRAEYRIVVDGQRKTVSSDVVSYAEIVELAYPGRSADKFTVTYRNAASEPHQGSLVPGHSVRIKREGTVFSVTPTTKS